MNPCIFCCVQDSIGNILKMKKFLKLIFLQQHLSCDVPWLSQKLCFIGDGENWLRDTKTRKINSPNISSRTYRVHIILCDSTHTDKAQSKKEPLRPSIILAQLPCPTETDTRSISFFYFFMKAYLKKIPIATPATKAKEERAPLAAKSKMDS